LSVSALKLSFEFEVYSRWVTRQVFPKSLNRNHNVGMNVGTEFIKILSY
jgi:hypothetical protein